MNTVKTVAPSALSLLAEVTGTPIAPQRLQALLAECAPILDEIARLRAVDLAEVHPAVIFDPTAVYRKAAL
jgi:hypothetical protein